MSITPGKHRLRITRLTDADSGYCDIFLKSSKEDLGFGIELQTRIALRDWPVRLCDLDGIELGDAGGIEAKEFIEGKILGKIVTGYFHLRKNEREKAGSFGRWVVEIWYGGENINLLMIEKGHAVPKKY